MGGHPCSLSQLEGVAVFCKKGTASWLRWRSPLTFVGVTFLKQSLFSEPGREGPNTLTCGVPDVNCAARQAAFSSRVNLFRAYVWDSAAFTLF